MDPQEESYYGYGGSLRTRRPFEELDPMSSVANLSDAMLVFACGLLIALVVAWNVDLGAVTQVEIDETQEVTEELDALDDAVVDGAGTVYVERGMVYEDPNTGKLYLLDRPDADGGDAAGARGTGE